MLPQQNFSAMLSFLGEALNILNDPHTYVRERCNNTFFFNICHDM